MLMQLISTCNIHILHSFKAYFAYAMEMHHLGSFILVLNVCFFAAVYKILNRFTGFWSAMFVVGCYDFKLGGGALFCDLFKTSKAAQSCFYLFIIAHIILTSQMKICVFLCFLQEGYTYKGILLGGITKPQTCLGRL